MKLILKLLLIPMIWLVELILWLASLIDPEMTMSDEAIEAQRSKIVNDILQKRGGDKRG